MIRILPPVFLLSVVLLGIHSFFGLEVIRRGIIFTDLAIGQMAALGAAVSLLAMEGRYLPEPSFHPLRCNNSHISLAPQFPYQSCRC